MKACDFMSQQNTKPNIATCPENINKVEEMFLLNKLNLTSSEVVPFGKGMTLINEYSPSLTDDELQSKKESIKTILAKAFFNDEKS